MRRSDHLVAVPNVSEGRDLALVERLVEAVEGAGARVLDVHTDPVHNRSVLTSAAEPPVLVDAMTALARAACAIDLSRHSGVHPRLGVLDVCPFVVDGLPSEVVAEVARAAGRSIADRAAIPVYLYGEAAPRPEFTELPRLRRSAHELPPDYGPTTPDPRRGVVCVGARGPLVAFNVWLRADLPTAKRIAAAVRAELG
ncbi:MAG: glutamate formiminotransferase, partial [Actinomycetota bacterium]|nr:glutamate formiminotransferase [Actinomycetota bacterium]